jgi:hypothetical protein
MPLVLPSHSISAGTSHFKTETMNLKTVTKLTVSFLYFVLTVLLGFMVYRFDYVRVMVYVFVHTTLETM